MKHFAPISRPYYDPTYGRRQPLPAFYYQLSLTQKLMELATLASMADSLLGSVKNLFAARE